MKRLSKIFLLILAITAILTAFTVVALAEGETEPKAVNVGGIGMETDFEHDWWTIGKPWSTGDGYAGKGVVEVKEAYSGGNKYLNITGTATGDGTTQSLTFLRTIATDSVDYSKPTTYWFETYPIVAIDFDLMTPNGDWGMRGADENSNNSAILFKPIYNNGTRENNSFPAKQISFGNLELPTTPYVWHHVTVIFEYFVEDGVAYLNQTTYTNGNKVSNSYCNAEKLNLTAIYGENASKIWVGPLTMQTSQYETTSQQAIDNIEFTYCETGYDVSKLPTAVYNDSWEAPFGKLLATVTTDEGVSYFDDINEAAQFAMENPGSDLALTGDMTSSYFVDAEITIDARKRNEAGEPTGEVYSGILENAKTTLGYYLEQVETGVFRSKLGNVALIDKEGIMTAYPASDFAKVCSTEVKTGYTVKLLSDIETDTQLLPTVAYTLDLNGKTLKRIHYSGNKYQATKTEGNDELIFGTENSEVVPALSAAEESFIKMNTNSRLTFKVTSSEEGGTVYNVTATADTWYYNGEVVKRENVTNITPKAFATHIEDNGTLDVSNISVYAATFVTSAHASIDNVVVKIDNCNYYQMGTGVAFYSLTTKNFTLDVSNSLLYFHVKDDILVQFKNESTSGTKTIVNFENCDIIKTNTSTGWNVAFYRGSKSPSYITTAVDNCRIFDIDFNADFTRFKNGSLYREDGSQTVEPAYDSNYTKESVYFTKSYTLPETQDFITATNGNVQYVSISDTTVLNYAFNRIITKPVDINWMDADGVTVVATTQLTPGVSKLDENAYKHIKELTDNEYLNILYQWTDNSGNAISGVLGADADALIKWPSNDSYSFYARESLNGVTKYIGGIKDVQFNLNFLTGFRYNLYIPVDDRLTDVVVDGYARSEATVLIGGAEYTVYSKVVGTAAAAEANTILATFKVDGEDYSQTWSINAVDYAKMLINDPYYNSEKEAAAKMVKFIKEAVLVKDAAADITALDEIITSSGVGLTYGDYATAGNADALVAFNGVIYDVYYSVYNGVAAYKFTLVNEETQLTFTVNGEEIKQTVNGNEITLEAMRVYDLIEPITISDGANTAEFKFVDYLTKLNGDENINLAKALYEFGLAADEYKKDIMKAAK